MSSLILRVPWSLDAGIGNEPEVLAVLSAPIEDLDGMTVQRRTTDLVMDVARVHRQFKCAAQIRATSNLDSVCVDTEPCAQQDRQCCGRCWFRLSTVRAILCRPHELFGANDGNLRERE